MRILDTDVCSISSRKNYLEKLEKLVSDFHLYCDSYSANELNLLALLLMESVNKSSMLGIDMQANLGGNVFTAINDDTLAHDRVISNANTHEMIEGPITYSSKGVNIFPTPLGFDPGFRVTISGIVQPDDEFTISYNLLGCADNRNGLVTERLYKKLIEE